MDHFFIISNTVYNINVTGYDWMMQFIGLYLVLGSDKLYIVYADKYIYWHGLIIFKTSFIYQYLRLGAKQYLPGNQGRSSTVVFYHGVFVEEDDFFF